MLIIKQVENYPGYYITSEGEVWSTIGKNVVVLSNFTSRDGYKIATLHKGGKKKYSVHRLVVAAFLPNEQSKRTVNHINGDKQDNRLENLEWATHKENSVHAYRSGLYSGVGEGHYKTNLTVADVLTIRANRESLSGVQLAKIYNVSSGAIYNIRKRLTWKHLKPE